MPSIPQEPENRLHRSLPDPLARRIVQEQDRPDRGDHPGHERSRGAGQDSRHRRIELLQAQLEEACRHGRIVSLQPPYSLFWRHAEQNAMPYCRENDITLLAYSPMAQGLLTGKFGKGHKFAKGDHRKRNKLFRQEHVDRVQRALDELRPIAEGRGSPSGNSRWRGSSHTPALARSRVRGMQNRSWKMRRRARSDSPRPIWPGWTRSGTGSRIPSTGTRSCGTSRIAIPVQSRFGVPIRFEANHEDEKGGSRGLIPGP